MNRLLIVHGYSDKWESFKPLAEFLKQENLYQDIRYVNYDSLDDQATFQDYADRLNDIYEENYPSERVDILCHSTGSLVVRAWMVLRRQRKLRRSHPALDVPVERLYLFAPANFGSDLATLGQSFLGQLKRFVSIGMEGTDDGDSAFEVGKQILQGLEPASPMQWLLSQFDLHGKQETGYFGKAHSDDINPCYAFVFAAGKVESFFGDRFVSNAIKPGTDSTVRICGTSLNTRKGVLRHEEELIDAPILLEEGNKVSNIPFAVFYDLNHTSIVGGKLNSGNFFSDERKTLDGEWSPLELLRKASQVSSLTEYEEMAREFARVNEANYQAWRQSDALLEEFKDADLVRRLKDRYQQIFFRFIDDVDCEVSDVFIDFYVYDAGNRANPGLTKELDQIFLDSEFYAHSVNKSHRVILFNYDRWVEFQQRLKVAGAKVIIEIYAHAVSSSSFYERCRHVIYDPAWSEEKHDGNYFFYPNTTTLIEVVLNRRQKQTLMTHR